MVQTPKHQASAGRVVWDHLTKYYQLTKHDIVPRWTFSRNLQLNRNHRPKKIVVSNLAEQLLLVVYCILSTLMSYKLNYKVNMCKGYVFVTLTIPDPHCNLISIYIYTLWLDWPHTDLSPYWDPWHHLVPDRGWGPVWRYDRGLLATLPDAKEAMTLDVANLGWLEKTCTQTHLGMFKKYVKSMVKAFVQVNDMHLHVSV